MVLTYKEKNWDRFRFSLNADNKMVAILPNSKAAIYKASEFDNQKENIEGANGNDFTFSMEVLDKKIENDDDISELLDLASDRNKNINNVFPNPFVSEFTIDYQTENDIEIEVMVADLSGRTVYNAKEDLNAGQHNIKVNIPDNQLTNGA